MAIELNHTIIHSRNAEESARFMAEILGLPPPSRFAHFHVVQASNGVSLDFLETREPIQAQHYAFLVTEEEFDQIFERIKARKIEYYADPAGTRRGQINRRDGGRGLYFADPSGHYLEILTRPYGSGA